MNLFYLVPEKNNHLALRVKNKKVYIRRWIGLLLQVVAWDGLI